jgi:hypothetical protein
LSISLVLTLGVLSLMTGACMFYMQEVFCCGTPV